jgi:aspartyl-tRNA(Asn)/glutamyl-tRNA(Gln) amidotransferase subunit A
LGGRTEYHLIPNADELVCYASLHDGFSMNSAEDIARAVRSGETNAQEIVAQALVRAESVQERTNAFISLAHTKAIERAREIDALRDRGSEIGKLAGVPIVIKDNISTEGLRSSAGSKSLESFVPPYSATVVERLEAAGAVVVGKANLDEFGMGGSNENSYFGPVRNPWVPSKVPGGSSGGSAVAVATGVVPLALGTDTGGSVRQPAAFTGVIGFKPTYGRLSRYGVMAFASSLDQVGVLSRSARDIALAMDVMGGHDSKDSTSLKDAPPHFLDALDAQLDPSKLSVGVVRELCGEGITREVQGAVDCTRATLERLGVSVGEVSLPHVRYGVPSYYLVATAEASSNLARFDGMIFSTRVGDNSEGQAEVMMRARGEAFGPEVRRRILMGTYALASGYYDAYYGKALKVRRLISLDFEQAFKDFDLLLTPTAPAVAFDLGEKVDDPLAMYLGDVCTCLANLVGLGAASIPVGFTEGGLPCGVQLLAPPLHDERLVSLVAAIEQDAGAGFSPLAPQ